MTPPPPTPGSVLAPRSDGHVSSTIRHASCGRRIPRDERRPRSQVGSSRKAPPGNMNALYVTVSIPMLLLLAGFNHAHGLTTFGKTPSNNNQPPPQPPAKTCTNHTTCKGINGASCVQDPRDHHKKSCLCGDNVPPQNGQCKANYRGPNHLCTENNQCVEGAKCTPLGKNPQPGGDKACKCLEGLVENHNMCNGGIPLSSLSGLIVLMTAITRTLIFN